MTLLRHALVILALLGSMAGCQWPLAEPTGRYQLAIQITRPAGTDARLLLPTAKSLTVTVQNALGDLVFFQTYDLSGRNRLVVSIPVAPRQSYLIEAKAFDAEGTPEFTGSMTVQTAAGLVASLSLLPVDTAGSLSWPQVRADAAIPGLNLSADVSTSFLLAWADGATAYSPPTLPPGLSLYIQSLPNGEIVDQGAADLLSSQVPQGAVLTFYATTPQALGAVGSFLVPVQTFALDGPPAVVVGQQASLSLQNLVPAYSSDGSLDDYSWNVTGPATVLSSGVIRSDAPGTAVVTATSVASGSSAQFSIVMTDAATVTFVPLGFESLDFGAATLTMMAPGDLTVTAGSAALQASGTDWEWKIDDKTLPDTDFTCVFAYGDPSGGDDHLLLEGLHSLTVSVTLNAIRFSASIPLAVNPVEAP